MQGPRIHEITSILTSRQTSIARRMEATTTSISPTSAKLALTLHVQSHQYTCLRVCLIQKLFSMHSLQEDMSLKRIQLESPVYYSRSLASLSTICSVRATPTKTLQPHRRTWICRHYTVVVKRRKTASAPWLMES
ncbi:hypothetical protein M3J07_001593 [Ascochyta lentis]